jgi:hypothetical protein
MKVKMLDRPKTKSEWWNNVNTAWDDIFGIMQTYINIHRKINGTTLKQYIINLKENQDPELVKWLGEAWMNIPEAAEIKIPHFLTLSDLCSEEYLVYDSN